MHFLQSLKGKLAVPQPSSTRKSPPQWAPAPEISHKDGLWNEAPEEEYESAERFCLEYPMQPPRLLPSDTVDRIKAVGCRAWGLEAPITPRFSGDIQNPNDANGAGAVRVRTRPECMDVCLLSDLPICAGLYDIQDKIGIYYEILVYRMGGIIAIGTSCRPYPAWRLPGWNRLSAGLHLDDLRKFFEDPDGGRDYTDTITGINTGDVVGCGYEFSTGTLFYTYNGRRLPPAFTGIYLPRHNYDVFAAIGVEGYCDFDVNFGGEPFRWREGDEWAWRVEGHIGRLGGSPRGPEDELPSYRAARGR